MSLTHGVEAFLVLVGVGCFICAVVWGRSSRRLHRAWKRMATEVEAGGHGADARDLIRSQFRKEVHTAGLYLAVAAVCLVISAAAPRPWMFALGVLVLPVGV